MSSDKSKSKWVADEHPREQKLADIKNNTKEVTHEECERVSQPQRDRNNVKRDGDRTIAGWSKYIVLLFNFLLVLLTGGLVWIGFRADDTNHQGERAFVAMNNITIRAAGQKQSNGDALYKISTLWENSGAAPTKHLKIGAAKLFDALPKEFVWPEGLGDGQPSVILPKQILNVDNLVIDGFSLNSFKNGTVLQVFGFASYEDVFGIRHITLSCKVVSADKMVDYSKVDASDIFSVGQCPDFNCADEDCAVYKYRSNLKKILDYLK